jgi:hypothetical protein
MYGKVSAPIKKNQRHGFGVNTASRKQAVRIIIEMKYFRCRAGRSSERPGWASVIERTSSVFGRARHLNLAIAIAHSP